MSPQKITVLGSFVVDLAFRTSHLPVRGETVTGSGFVTGPGGKGSNQAVAAKRAGADVTIVARVGKDRFAGLAFESFRNEGMTTSYIFEDQQHPTAAAAILVDENSGENQIVVALGACLHFSAEEVESARAEIESSDILLLQLEANLDAVELAMDIARANGVKVVLNPAPARPDLTDELIGKAHILTPNETEAAILTGLEVETVASVEGAKRAAKLLLAKGPEAVIVTLGEKGVLLSTADQELVIEPARVDAVDTTGAGDAFNGGLVTAMADGKTLAEACRFANAVGALCATRPGTAPAMPYRDEIYELLRRQ